MAIGVAHIGVAQRMHIALAVERPHLDDALARLDAIGAGIHPQRTADGAGNAVVEMKAADTSLIGDSGKAFVGRGRARLDRGRRNHFGFAKALGRKPDDEARNTAVTDKQVRADTDGGQRYVFGHCSQERSEIVFVGRLEQRVGQPAGAEPGDLVHLGIRRDAAAQAGKPVAKLVDQRLAARHEAVPPSSLGSA